MLKVTLLVLLYMLKTQSACPQVCNCEFHKLVVLQILLLNCSLIAGSTPSGVTVDCHLSLTLGTNGVKLLLAC